MTDHGETQDQAQPEYAQELAELLNLLENVDRQITPEHVARRSRELLGDPGKELPPVPTASGGDLEHFGVAFESTLHGLADSLMSPQLREVTTARAAARLQVEQASRRAEEMQDRALAKAARIEAAAREQAARILDEARQAEAEAEQRSAELRIFAQRTLVEFLMAHAFMSALYGPDPAVDRTARQERANLAHRYLERRWAGLALRCRAREDQVLCALDGTRWMAGEPLELPAGLADPAALRFEMNISINGVVEERGCSWVAFVTRGSLSSDRPANAAGGGQEGQSGIGAVVPGVDAGLVSRLTGVLPVLPAWEPPGYLVPAVAHPEPAAATFVEMPTAAAELGVILLPD